MAAREASTGLSVRTVLRRAAESISGSAANAPPGFAETPYLDAMVLVSHVTGWSKEQLFGRMDESIDAERQREMDALVARRSEGYPIAYLTGTKEFYGRPFAVDERVLIPRPESELLVETTLEALPRSDAHVHDACTGSGAVAITLAAERETLLVTASDISEDALAVARANAGRLLPPERAVTLAKSDLLSAFGTPPLSTLPPPEIIVANPPYLSESEYHELHDHGWPEPEIALVSGDGLSHLNRLCEQAFPLLPDHGLLICEIGAMQGFSAEKVISLHGFADCTLVEDLAGRPRVCMARKSVS